MINTYLIDKIRLRRIIYFFFIDKITRYPIYPTPPLGQVMTQGQFFSEV